MAGPDILNRAIDLAPMIWTSSIQKPPEDERFYVGWSGVRSAIGAREYHKTVRGFYVSNTVFRQTLHNTNNSLSTVPVCSGNSDAKT